MAEVPKNSEEWVKKNAEWLKKNNEKGHDPAKSSAELFTMICNDLRIKERRNRDELAREWNSYDPRIRMQCISAPQGHASVLAQAVD